MMTLNTNASLSDEDTIFMTESELQAAFFFSIFLHEYTEQTENNLYNTRKQTDQYIRENVQEAGIYVQEM